MMVLKRDRVVWLGWPIVERKVFTDKIGRT